MTRLKSCTHQAKKLSLSTFLATVEMMLSEWLKRSYEDSFHIFPPVNTEQDKEGWK